MSEAGRRDTAKRAHLAYGVAGALPADISTAGDDRKEMAERFDGSMSARFVEGFAPHCREWVLRITL